MTELATDRRSLRPALTVNLAVLGGLMLTSAMPPFPPTVAPAVLGLTLLVEALRRSERPGRTAWIFGLAHQGSVLHWLFFLDPAKSIPSRALVPVQAIAAIVYVSIFYLALGLVFGLIRRRLGAGVAVGVFPLLWYAMETLRGVGELGFPWCLSGCALAGGPAAFLYRAAGEQGAGLALVLMATVIARWRSPGRGRFVTLAATGVWLVFLVVGAGLRLPTPAAQEGPDGDIAAAVIQPDVALADKWASGRIDSTRIPLTRLTREAADRGARFVVWPETAVPAYLRYDRGLLDWVRETVRADRVFLFTGFPDAERAPDGRVIRYNSSGLFTPRGNLVGQYAKHHLLPIGEAMPFERWLPLLSHVDLGQAEWSPGERPEPLLVPDEVTPFRFGCLVCFESAFGQLARPVVRAGARCLVVITNDGWFGRSAGPVQHAMLARIRAVECAVPVLRSANNGISYICDDRGRLLGELPVGRRGLVRADVPLGRADTLFLRAGSLPAWAFLVVLAGTHLMVFRTRKGEEDD